MLKAMNAGRLAVATVIAPLLLASPSFAQGLTQPMPDTSYGSSTFTGGDPVVPMPNSDPVGMEP